MLICVHAYDVIQKRSISHTVSKGKSACFASRSVPPTSVKACPCIAIDTTNNGNIYYYAMTAFLKYYHRLKLKSNLSLITKLTEFPTFYLDLAFQNIHDLTTGSSMENFELGPTPACNEIDHWEEEPLHLLETQIFGEEEFLE